MPGIRLPLVIVLLAAATGVSAMPEHSPWPGGIAVIDVAPADAPRPVVEFGERQVLVARRG